MPRGVFYYDFEAGRSILNGPTVWYLIARHRGTTLPHSCRLISKYFCCNKIEISLRRSLLFLFSFFECFPLLCVSVCVSTRDYLWKKSTRSNEILVIVFYSLPIVSSFNERSGNVFDWPVIIRSYNFQSIRLAIDFNQFITIKGHAIRATRWPQV